MKKIIVRILLFLVFIILILLLMAMCYKKPGPPPSEEMKELVYHAHDCDSWSTDDWYKETRYFLNVCSDFASSDIDKEEYEKFNSLLEEWVEAIGRDTIDVKRFMDAFIKLKADGTTELDENAYKRIKNHCQKFGSSNDMVVLIIDYYRSLPDTLPERLEPEKKEPEKKKPSKTERGKIITV